MEYIRTCRVCGKEFTSLSANASYCSDAHRREAARRRGHSSRLEKKREAETRAQDDKEFWRMEAALEKATGLSYGELRKRGLL